ncbi:MAG: HNH endonuclease [Hormoscilla sp. GM7CHS1pb]|nr:HNH endonuclease [Hormoscilla sp. GM7CHS1pb]
MIGKRILTLMKKQKGKCGHCQMLFVNGDKWEVDHVVPRSLGGKDVYTNLQLLHDYCHHKKSAADGSHEGRTRIRDIEAEEPDEAKVSRPVLETSRSGDGLA